MTYRLVEKSWVRWPSLRTGRVFFGNIQKELNMTKEKTDKNKVSYMVKWIVSQSFLHLVGGYIGASFGMVGLKCLRVTVVRSTECHVLRMANRDSCNAYVYINICWHSVKSCYVYVIYTCICIIMYIVDDCIVSVSVNETMWKHLHRKTRVT